VDSLTHLAMGAVIGEAVLGREQGKRAWLWGAIIAAFPDIDVTFKYLFTPAGGILFHRGMTHSILICTLLVFAFGYLLNRLYGNDKSYRGWHKLVAWCLFSHIFIDIFNSYSVTLFWPLNIRVVFDSMGIFDGMFIFPFFAAFISFLFLRKKVWVRKRMAIIAICMATLYLGFTSINKLRVESKVRNELKARGERIGKVRAAPLPLTNFMWMVMAEEKDGSGFWQTSVTTLNKRNLTYSFIAKNSGLSDEFANDKEFKRIKRFSRGFYAITTDSLGNKYFCDLRFPNFDFFGDSPPINAVVKYELKVDEKGNLELDWTAPIRKISWDRLKTYFLQIRGKYEYQLGK
jgi:inner membrane protein